MDCGDRDCDGRDCMNDNDEETTTTEASATDAPVTGSTPEPLIECADLPCDEDGYVQQQTCTQCICECAGGYGFPICCQPGLVFDLDLGACEYPDLVGCPPDTDE